MYSNYYNGDSMDITVHYRLYRNYQGQVSVVCVQNFDYPDYNEDGFFDPTFYLNELEAERALLIHENPNEYIPELYETHYRVYQTPEDEEARVVTVDGEVDYENYNLDYFIDGYFKEWDAADAAAYWHSH